MKTIDIFELTKKAGLILENNFIFGFKTFADAESFADEVGGTVNCFTKRNGCGWIKKGIAYSAYSVDDMLHTFGDNYKEVDSIDPELIRADILYLLRDFDNDFSEIKKFIASQEYLQSEIDNALPDEAIITSEGIYYTTVKRENMGYHYDVTSYGIGVALK